ncbi:MAG: ISL3 family transposase [Deltaproteobacteria bacterium]|nr:ISL3 family transposase [Deltaproteobacteria bacterium]
MRDRELYAKIMGISTPWSVEDVEVDLAGEKVLVKVACKDGPLPCPECGKSCPRYDSRSRSWRHLDTMQFETFLVADVPRVKCEKDGVHQVKVPWAEKGSHFTAMFECLVIDWLKEASIEAVARQLRMTWDQVDGIMARAVQRGKARRAPVRPKVIGVDEKAFKKRHEYVTIVCDALTGDVLHVGDERKAAALEEFYESLSPRQKSGVMGVAMDMWPAYIAATQEHLPNAQIIFDRFHVMKHIGEAVDQVRRVENRELLRLGDRSLVGSKYLFLTNHEDLAPERKRLFKDLKLSSLQVARAYALKETARHLWGYKRLGWARRNWNQWISWARRSRLEPMKRAAATVRDHLDGILNAVVTGVSNAVAEGLNSRIQTVKQRACGFRNRERFKNAIYFHLGGLDLYPSVSS